MIRHTEITKNELRKRIRNGSVSFAGNIPLKIYGKLNCKSGKRMKKQNRIFFQSQKEATGQGFRPCAHCLNGEYRKYKTRPVSL